VTPGNIAVLAGIGYFLGACGMFGFQCNLYLARNQAPRWLWFWSYTLLWLPVLLVAGLLTCVEVSATRGRTLPWFFLNIPEEEEN
jgi:H+/Cl- antiporter ClcA